MWWGIPVKLVLVVLGQHVARLCVSLHILHGNDPATDAVSQYGKPVTGGGVAVHIINVDAPILDNSTQHVQQPQQRVSVHGLAVHLVTVDLVSDDHHVAAKQPVALGCIPLHVIDDDQPVVLYHNALLHGAVPHHAVLFRAVDTQRQPIPQPVFLLR